MNEGTTAFHGWCCVLLNSDGEMILAQTETLRPLRSRAVRAWERLHGDSWHKARRTRRWECVRVTVEVE